MNVSTPFASLALKLAGTIILISSLIDFIFLSIPFNWESSQWQINFIDNLVQRGVFPLIAITFLLVGWWLDDSQRSSQGQSPSSVRLSVFIIASILGLVFLLLVPLNLSNISRANADVLTQIDAQVSQQEGQIQGFIAQLNAIAQNPEQLSQQIAQRNQVIEAGEIQGRKLTQQQLQILRNQTNELEKIFDLSKKPDELKERLKQLQQRLEGQLKEVRLKQENVAKTTVLKQSLRTGINSLILAIVYIAIGWLGLKGFTSGQTISDKN